MAVWPENKSEGWGDPALRQAKRANRPLGHFRPSIHPREDHLLCLCIHSNVTLTESLSQTSPELGVVASTHEFTRSFTRFSFLVLGSVPGHNPNITFRGCSFLCDYFPTGQGTQSLSYPH